MFIVTVMILKESESLFLFSVLNLSMNTLLVTGSNYSVVRWGTSREG